LLFALFLRLYRLDYYPPPGGISWNDEAQTGKDAHLILTGDAHPWQFPLITYPTALTFALFGENTFALRLVPDLWGFLTLIAFYFLAAEAFTTAAALIATFLFAVSRWHIALTRLSFPVTTSTFLAVTLFWLLIRGLRTRSAWNFLGAGLLLGLGFYDYAAFKIVPVFVLCLLITRWLQSAADYANQLPVGVQLTAFTRRLFHMDRRIAACVFMLIVGMAIALVPFIGLLQSNPPAALTERYTTVLAPLFSEEPLTITNWNAAQRHIAMLLLFFNVRGEPWGAVNLPFAPMLDPLTGALFVLALGYALLTFWRREQLTWLVWFLVTLSGGGVFVDIFRSHRFALALPTIFLLIGALTDDIYRAANRPDRRATRKLVRSALLCVVIVWSLCAAYVNYDLFFNQQIYRADVRMEYDHDIAAVANAIAAWPNKPYIYLMADWPFYTAEQDFGWLAGVPRGRRIFSLSEAMPTSNTRDEDIAYVIAAPYDDETLSAVVRAVYPNAHIEAFKSPYRAYTFHIAYVGLTEQTNARPPQNNVRVSYFDAAKPTQPITTQLAPVIAFTRVDGDWEVTPFKELQGKPYFAQWDARLQITQTSNYRFKLETRNGSIEMWLDGRMALQEAGRAQERITREVVVANFSAGTHDLRVKFTPLSGEASSRLHAGFTLRWVGPDGVERALPPSVFVSN
jgi:4-amino-4-deoxy-L-arabinose transferase-like glycosyltransferase